MAKAYHEALHPLGNLGIQVSMAALENTHIPAHRHEAMGIWNYITSNAARFLWMIQNPPRIFTSVSLHTI